MNGVLVKMSGVGDLFFFLIKCFVLLNIFSGIYDVVIYFWFLNLLGYYGYYCGSVKKMFVGIVI